MTTEMFYGAYSFIPVPLFTETVEVFRDQKFDALFKRTTREFTGVLLNSTNIEVSGAFPNIFAQREQLKQALCSGQQEFRILFDGTHLVSGEFPRINGPVFEEGTWVDRIDYTFTAELDEQLADSPDAIQSFNETWQFEEAEDNQTVAVDHQLSAVGINTAGSGANNSFTNARTYVLGKTGFANAQANAPFFAQVSGTPFSAFEELRTEQHDIAQGSFVVSERFILSSGNFIHVQDAQFQVDSEGITTINLNGNVRGFGRKPKNVGFDRAKTAFNNQISPRLAQDASGIYSNFNGEATLFTNNPQSFNITQTPFAGTIDYSISFTDSPADDLPSGILDFNISVNTQEPIRVFASFAIMERTLGNVIQDVGTSTPGNITITGNAVGKPGFPFNNLLAFVEDKINENRPDPNDYVTLIPAGLSVNKNELENSVSFNVQYQFTEELSQVFGDASSPVIIT